MGIALTAQRICSGLGKVTDLPYDFLRLVIGHRCDVGDDEAKYSFFKEPSRKASWQMLPTQRRCACSSGSLGECRSCWPHDELRSEGVQHSVLARCSFVMAFALLQTHLIRSRADFQLCPNGTLVNLVATVLLCESSG
jgi:hypothetical protein